MSAAPTRPAPGPSSPVLSVRDLQVHFRIPASPWPWVPPNTLRAVNGISLELAAGETLGVVGESGCGKSTLARALINLVPRTSGEVVWMGKPLEPGDSRGWHDLRQHVQMIFQDPLASLNPRWTVEQIIAEPLHLHRPQLGAAAIREQVHEMMRRVGLRTDMLNRYPHEFSGGQCQRIGIARALVLRPRVVICDEPVSALDVSIQAQIVGLLRELQAELDLTLIFIAHDLAVVRHLCDRVLVLYLGQMMELGPCREVFAQPAHPYTRALISAIPVPDPEVERQRRPELLGGDLPSPLALPSGCPLHTRCPQAEARCASETPRAQAVDTSGLHLSSCWKSAHA
ncbi:oligopeptide/dipeptide ABC transporter ATP-binding protein [Amphibiibacter pelophylacis]|uniref:ATP-binding cassette domain-containing protein n=1 Tax=Amphibiibacter pelophylacis TaxID=1799477 RepID=A0ACC6P2S4_9BURK